MFTPNALTGDPGRVADYRKADNYHFHVQYRKGEQAVGNFANKFSGRLAGDLGLIGSASYSDKQFAEFLSGKYGDSKEMHVERREYKKGGKRKQRIGMELNYAPPKSVSIDGLLFENVDALEAHKAGTRAANQFIEDNCLFVRMHLDEVEEAKARGEEVEYRMINAKKKTCLVKVNKMLVTEVLHTISRFNAGRNIGGDMQTHSHDVAMNDTFAFGKMRPIVWTDVYKRQHLIDAVYKTAMREHLEKKGYRCVTTAHGFELDGYDRKAIEIFSDGRCERIVGFIDSENKLRENPDHPMHGKYLSMTSAADRQFANDKTRGKKDAFSFEKAAESINGNEDKQTLREKDHGHDGDEISELEVAQRWWTLKAADRGLDVNKLKEQVHQTRMAPEPEQDVLSPEELVQLASESLTERSSKIKDTFHLAAQAMKMSGYKASFVEVRKTISQFLNDGKLVVRDDGVSITTRERIDAEREIESLYKEGLGKVNPISSRKMFDEQRRQYETEKGFTISKGQARAAKGFVLSKDATCIVIGRAGTGKSTMVELIRNVVHAEGGRIFGLAPSAKAVEALADSIGSLSEADKAAMKRETEKKYRPHVISTQMAVKNEKWWEENVKPGTVITIDEAGLVGAEHMKILKQMAKKYEARLLIVGDHEQYASVEAGSSLAHLDEIAKENEGSHFILDEMMRGKDEETRELHNAAYADQEDALKLMAEKGRMVVMDDEHETFVAMAEMYMKLSEEERDNTFVITSLNADRKKINKVMREAMGFDLKPCLEFDSYERYTNFTRAELKIAANYQEGETIFFNTETKPFKKGEAVTVKRIEGSRVIVSRTVEKDGREVEEDAVFEPRKMGSSVSLGVKERMRLAEEGERIRFTSAIKKYGVRNGDKGIVESIDFNKRVAKIRMIGTDLKNPKIINVDLPEFSKGIAMRSALCFTGHSSQGGTSSKGAITIRYTPMRASLDKNSFYTDVTRSVKNNISKNLKSFTLFTDARGAHQVQKLMEKASTAMPQDRAMSDRKVKKAVIRNAFTDRTGWKSVYAEEKEGEEKISLVEKIKNASKTLGTSKIGLRGSIQFVKSVAKAIIDSKLDIKLDNKDPRVQKIFEKEKEAAKERNEKIAAYEAAKATAERAVKAAQEATKASSPAPATNTLKDPAAAKKAAQAEIDAAMAAGARDPGIQVHLNEAKDNTPEMTQDITGSSPAAEPRPPAPGTQPSPTPRRYPTPSPHRDDYEHER